MIIDYLQRAKELILSPYKSLRFYVAIIEAIGEECAEVATFYDEIKNGTSLSTAIGLQLDLLGQKHGEPRLSRTDEYYQAAIKARIAFNQGNTNAEALYAIAQGFYGTDAELVYIEYQDEPSTFILRYVNVPDDANLTILEQYANDLTRIDAAGTRGIIEYVWENEPFGFEGNANAEGFGVGQLSGGWD